jgi:predicted permease
VLGARVNDRLRRAFRWTLRLYPRAFRERFGDAMTEAFLARVRARRGVRGRLAAAAMTAGAILDTVWHGVAERRFERERARWTNPRKEHRRMTALTSDLRHAWRRMRGRPGPSLLAIGMLALAIGVTTAMFTVVDALLLRPVPFPDADRLAHLVMLGPRGGSMLVPPAVLRAWQDSAVFEAVEGATTNASLVETSDGPIVAEAAYVSPALLDLLGAAPIRGRLLDSGDAVAGADGVVISESIWNQVLGRRPDAIGTRIRVDGQALVIIGILPADFRFPTWKTSLWRGIDFMAPPASARAPSPAAYVRFARTIPQADALQAATTIAWEVDPFLSKTTERVATAQQIAGASSREYFARFAPFLTGGAALVFLVLCANVASLLMAQMTARGLEFRTCAALGASRRRLFRQALTESAALGLLGMVGGIALTAVLVSLARVFLPESFMLESLNPLDVDGRALAAACAIGFGAIITAGLLPAWSGTRVDGISTLATGERAGTETRLTRRATRTLLVAEIAFGCTLLVGAGLLVRSFVNLAQVDRGLDASGVITGWLRLSLPEDATEPDRRAAADRLMSGLRAMPGVQQVALSYGLPPDGSEVYFGDDWQSDRPGAPPVDLMVNGYPVTQDFFDLYGIRLLAGRTFEPGDDRYKMIVGERFAEILWPGENPIGRTYRRGDSRPYEVIGLVNETRHPTLERWADLPEVYYRFEGGGSSVMMSIRCGAACPDVARLRQQLLAGPVSSVTRLGVLEDVYRESLARPRAAAALAAAFAVIAVLAASGGLFSVLSYAVGRRRREFGIRASLGARPADLQRQVVGEGVRLAIAGVGLGCFGAWLASRWIQALMYEVSSVDPATWTIVVGVVAATTLLAAWAPSRRAGRVNPVELLREQ